MNLLEVQKNMFEVVRTPLTKNERSRSRTVEGRSADDIARCIIKPNDRLSARERLEIYNRQYWFRLIGALMEDFEGLRALVGEDHFQKLAVAYLNECPSRSFTLRNLGSRLPAWLSDNPKYAGRRHELAIDVARLEWAEVLAFDEESRPAISVEDLVNMGDGPKLALQPHVQLLELSYEADDLLLKIRRKSEQSSASSNSAASAMRSKSAPLSIPNARKRKTYLGVHRHDYSVYFKRLDRRAYQLLTSLRDDGDLAKALAAVDWEGADQNHIAREVQQWFANWASLGWLVSAHS